MLKLPKSTCVYGLYIPGLKIVEIILFNRDHIHISRKLLPRLKRELRNKLPTSGNFLHHFRQFHEQFIADMFFKYGNSGEGAKLLSALASTHHVAGGPRFCVIEVRPSATGPSPFNTEVFNIKAGNADDAVMHLGDSQGRAGSSSGLVGPPRPITIANKHFEAAALPLRSPQKHVWRTA